MWRGRPRPRAKKIAGSSCCRRPKFENCYSALRLCNLPSSARVALARIGFRFFRKREILASRLFRDLSSLPPVVKRDPCADEEHHHDNRNYHHCGLACGLARRGRCSRCSRSAGSLRRRSERGGFICLRDRSAGRLSRRRRGSGCCCRFMRACCRPRSRNSGGRSRCARSLYRRADRRSRCSGGRSCADRWRRRAHRRIGCRCRSGSGSRTFDDRLRRRAHTRIGCRSSRCHSSRCYGSRCYGSRRYSSCGRRCADCLRRCTNRRGGCCCRRRCADRLRRSADICSRCSRCRRAVCGDHVQCADSNAVLSSAFLRGEVYVLAHIRLEISTAGSDLENLARVVFCNGVVALRAAQASFNVHLVGVAARRGSLCKPHRDQQCRYNDQQEYSLHRILLEVPPCGGLNSAWV